MTQVVSGYLKGEVFFFFFFVVLQAIYNTNIYIYILHTYIKYILWTLILEKYKNESFSVLGIYGVSIGLYNGLYKSMSKFPYTIFPREGIRKTFHVSKENESCDLL